MARAIRLSALAERVGGKLDGASDPVIVDAATLEVAGPGEITFAESDSALRQLVQSSAAAAVVPLHAPAIELPVIRVSSVRGAFNQIVQLIRPPHERAAVGISPAAHVSPHARLAADVEVYPGAVIEDDVEIGPGCRIYPHVTIMSGCRIGAHVTLYPQVTLYENTILGDRVILHAGVVLGAYGFGYETVDGRHQRGAQFGAVVVEDDVEIGACSTVDRGSYAATRIGAGTKIDNHVMIAHNCQIGRHNLLCSQVGIAGSSTTGDYVVMAGQVGVPDHVHIGQRAVLGAKAGILRDVPEGATMLGIPATPEREQMVRQATWAKLPELRKELKSLRRLVEQFIRPADAA